VIASQGVRATAPVASTTEPWVSVEDVAAHLGVAKDSVYRWIEAKRMPAHKIGKLWKFKLSEVDEWVRGGGANEAEKAKPVRKARTRKGR
jgi:excisionase family DNA binding protein